MELTSIISSLKNKTIFVTGATGFLAKIFLEKILRVQPNIAKIYVVLRAANAESSVQRLHDEVLNKDLFKVVREKYGENLDSLISEKVVALPGDISVEGLGLKNYSLRDQMMSEIDIIVNFAATTKFDERYEVALSTNTFGALHVLNFAKTCAKLKILVHVSTAYVCGEDKGLILENSFLMGEVKKGISKIDINAEMRFMQQKLNKLSSENVSEKAITSAMKEFGLERARLYGWPNTYVFTKAMGEMIMVHLRESVPVVIARPTMITSTVKDPFPGWIEGLRTMDTFVAGYGRGRLSSFVFNPKTICDLIPADMVVNAIIVAMTKHWNQHENLTIYQLGSSLRNPFKYSDLRDVCFRYFNKHPWINEDGNPVKVDHKFKVWNSMTNFNIYITIRYSLPLKALNLLSVVTSHKYKKKFTSLYQKKKRMMRIFELYAPYLFFNGIFDDRNTVKLQNSARLEFVEAEAFDFDSKSLDWEDYMMNVHIPGLVRFAIRN